MSDTTANDRAFIKVSTELLRLRNDYTAIQSLATVNSNMNTYSRELLRKARPDALHSEEFKGFSRVLQLMGDIEEQRRVTIKIKAKIDELEQLCEAYVLGRDIVAEKLSRDT